LATHASLRARQSPRRVRPESYLLSGSLLTGLYLGVGAYHLAHIPDRERLYERYRARMNVPGADQAQIAADMEEQLLTIRDEDRDG
jgi:hypothetical protein